MRNVRGLPPTRGVANSAWWSEKKNVNTQNQHQQQCGNQFFTIKSTPLINNCSLSKNVKYAIAKQQSSLSTNTQNTHDSVNKTFGFSSGSGGDELTRADDFARHAIVCRNLGTERRLLY
jgi:hypothetical protein